jgi:aspartate kinase
VDGVFTTDPNVYEKAKKIDKLTFEEMLELSSLGAKVLQIRSVEFASKYNMPIRVKSSFTNDEGTLINGEENMEDALISGVTHSSDDAKLTIRKVPDIPGIAAKILDPISSKGIEVDIIIQNVSEDKTTDFTFTVKREKSQETKKILSNLSKEFGGGEIELNDDISKVSLVGVGMKSHAGVAATMFKTLAEKNINIEMISTSEIKISVVVKENLAHEAVKSLHDAFNLEN